MLAALKKEKVKIDGKLIFGETSIRVIPDERGNGVWDLRSGEDNLRAADFMLRQIRQYTESSDVYCPWVWGGRTIGQSFVSLTQRRDHIIWTRQLRVG